LPAPEENDQTLNYQATFETGNGDAQYDFECEYTVAGTGPPVAPPLTITTATLPQATDGVSYSTLLESSGGSTAFNNIWTLVFNDGASGLSLTGSGATSGVLSWNNP